MDINRTLTDNIFFRKGPGVHKLEQVLIAYSRRNPAVGYCQGMNMIAASLLLIMPTEEDAFWVLVSIVENILPKTYFEPSLLASRADQIVGLFVPAARPILKFRIGAQRVCQGDITTPLHPLAQAGGCTGSPYLSVVFEHFHRLSSWRGIFYIPISIQYTLTDFLCRTGPISSMGRFIMY